MHDRGRCKWGENYLLGVKKKHLNMILYFLRFLSICVSVSVSDTNFVGVVTQELINRIEYLFIDFDLFHFEIRV